MAERIDALPERGIRGGGVQDAWLDGSAWKLQQGTDYERTTKSMRGALAAAGRARGLRMRSRSLTEGGREALAVQFVPRDDAAAEASGTEGKPAAPARQAKSTG